MNNSLTKKPMKPITMNPTAVFPQIFKYSGHLQWLHLVQRSSILTDLEWRRMKLAPFLSGLVHLLMSLVLLFAKSFKGCTRNETRLHCPWKALRRKSCALYLYNEITNVHISENLRNVKLSLQNSKQRKAKLKWKVQGDATGCNNKW
jgi:hypothetical protein